MYPTQGSGVPAAKPPKNWISAMGRSPNGGQDNSECGSCKGLTCIHRRIHCAATQGTTNGDNELEKIQIDYFVSTLAEVALAIARRKDQLNQ